MELNNKGLYILKNDDYVPYNMPQGKVILCGVPGAFTTGCNKHLPGFANNLDKLDAKVVFVAVNDPSVMHEWNILFGHPDIDAVADPLAMFTKNINKDIDFGDYMGIRCKRYAMLIQDGVFVKEYENPFIEGVL